MTGLVAEPTRLWSEPAWSSPLDRPIPDTWGGSDAEFVVEWQVADLPQAGTATPDAFAGVGLLLS